MYLILEFTFFLTEIKNNSQTYFLLKIKNPPGGGFFVRLLLTREAGVAVS